jgi:hypothetical protein
MAALDSRVVQQSVDWTAAADLVTSEWGFIE